MNPPPYVFPIQFREIVAGALLEDLGQAGDLTGQAIFDPSHQSQGKIVARQAGIAAGLAVATEVFHQLDPHFQAVAQVRDGELVASGQVLATLSGATAVLLAGERTALNFLGRMCGIATMTHQAVQRVAGTSAKVAATRKTTPGLRLLEKYAVKCGGGMTHRYRLDDAVMIKDNHVALAGGVVAAVQKVRAFVGHLTKVECEVDGLQQFQELIESGQLVDVVLLDNFSPEQISTACQLRQERGYQCLLEASGGITLDNLAQYAEAGADVISLGSLTHSARCLDVALDV